MCPVDSDRYMRDGSPSHLIHLYVYPHVVGFLKDMQKSGYRLGIVTHGMSISEENKPMHYSLLDDTTRYLHRFGITVDAVAEISDQYHFFNSNPHIRESFQDRGVIDIRDDVLALAGKGNACRTIPMWYDVARQLNLNSDQDSIYLVMVGDRISDAKFCDDVRKKHPNIDGRAILITRGANKEELVAQFEDQDFVANQLFMMADWFQINSVMMHIRSAEKEPPAKEGTYRIGRFTVLTETTPSAAPSHAM